MQNWGHLGSQGLTGGGSGAEATEVTSMGTPSGVGEGEGVGSMVRHKRWGCQEFLQNHQKITKIPKNSKKYLKTCSSDLVEDSSIH